MVGRPFLNAPAIDDLNAGALAASGLASGRVAVAAEPAEDCPVQEPAEDCPVYTPSVQCRPRMATGPCLRRGLTKLSIAL